MRAGTALRQAWELDRLGAKLCSCGHRMDAHHELKSEFYAVADAIVTVTANPDYRPLHFHCDECKCVWVPA